MKKLIFVTTGKEVENEEIPTEPYFYIKHLAGRIHWNVENLRKIP